MKPEIAALVLHPMHAVLLAHHKHGHSVSLWATAHGAQGEGPRILVLAVAAIICAVVISLATSRKKSSG